MTLSSMSLRNLRIQNAFLTNRSASASAIGRAASAISTLSSSSANVALSSLTMNSAKISSCPHNIKPNHDHIRFFSYQNHHYKSDDSNGRELLANQILHEIPLGNMTTKQVRSAVSLLFAYTQDSKRQSKAALQHAQKAEEILERIIAERTDGDNYDAVTQGASGDIHSHDSSYQNRDGISHRKRLYDVFETKAYNAIIDAYGKSRTREGPLKAEQLLKRMIDRYESHVRDYVNVDGDSGTASYHSMNDSIYRYAKPAQPNIITYNALMNAWCHSSRDEAVSKAEEIINMLQESSNGNHRSGSTNNITPDGITYNIIMNTYANQINEFGYAQKAEDILLLMSQYQLEANSNLDERQGNGGFVDKSGYHSNDNSRNHGRISITPNTMSFNIVLKAWKNSAGTGIESAKRGEDILRLMMKLYKDGHLDVKPDVISFMTVVQAFVRPRHEDRERGIRSKMGLISEEVVGHLEGIADLLLNDGEDGKDPDHCLSQAKGLISQTMNYIIDCIGRSDCPDAADRAKGLLDRMIERDQQKGAIENHQYRPDALAFSHVIHAYAKNPKTAHKSQELLQELIANDSVDSNLHNGKHSVTPDTFIMNKVLHSHCRAKNITAAEELFHSMTNLANTRGYDTLPDIASYNMIANMYFISPKSDSAQKAMCTMEQMEEQYDMGGLPKLDHFVYSVLINKLSKNRDNKMQMRSYDVLMKMIDRFDRGDLDTYPDTVTHNLVLSTLSKMRSTGATHKALDLLDMMEERSKNNHRDVGPDTLSYSHVLVSLSRTMTDETPEKLLTLLVRMKMMEEKGSEIVQLDNPAFETVLMGLSHPKHGNRELLEKTLEQMFQLSKNGHQKVKPNSLCLNLAIKSQCSNKGRKEGQMPAFEAHRYLMKLVEDYKEGRIDILPDRVGFNTVINCWARTGHWKKTAKAEEIYNLMQQLSKEKVENVEPDKYTNAVMLKMFARSPKKSARHKAQTFFDSLDPCDLDSVAYNELLTIWAGASEENDTSKQSNLSRILEIYRELITLDPDEVSFAIVIKACASLAKNKNESELHMSRVFHDACERGLLGHAAIGALRLSVPEERREKVFGHSLNGSLDKKWTRNLKPTPESKNYI